MRTFLNLMLSAGILLVAACGDDDEGSRPRYASGLDPSVASSAPVADLSDTDLQRVCASFDAFVSTQLDFDLIAYAACLPGALLLSPNQAACQRTLDDCIDAFPEPLVVQARLQNEAVCFSDLRACRATVSALEGCVNLRLDFVYDLLDQISCRRFGDSQARGTAERAMSTLQACADISAACNDFIDIARGPD